MFFRKKKKGGLVTVRGTFDVSDGDRKVRLPAGCLFKESIVVVRERLDKGSRVTLMSGADTTHYGFLSHASGDAIVFNGLSPDRNITNDHSFMVFVLEGTTTKGRFDYKLVFERCL